ncbi:hypothetical protein F5876DRAFT_85035 [Lentinula aff. lateritia]|uniref:Uncharacterized protein n=1 Tax=Lentinula aff. lateritia TaxID=2804960 RepID=A0ACC1TFN4_9AGAR|nr:hypothetical protein F5876DRAFT_85035 [Lentinula aff. lateritia]
MVQYIHHITDTPLDGPVSSDGTNAQGSIPSIDQGALTMGPQNVAVSVEGVVVAGCGMNSPSSDAASPRIPLFLPEQESPTFPSPPPASPDLPPLWLLEEAHASRDLGLDSIDVLAGPSTLKEESVL